MYESNSPTRPCTLRIGVKCNCIGINHGSGIGDDIQDGFKDGAGKVLGTAATVGTILGSLALLKKGLSTQTGKKLMRKTASAILPSWGNTKKGLAAGGAAYGAYKYATAPPVEAIGKPTIKKAAKKKAVKRDVHERAVPLNVPFGNHNGNIGLEAIHQQPAFMNAVNGVPFLP